MYLFIYAKTCSEWRKRGGGETDRGAGGRKRAHPRASIPRGYSGTALGGRRQSARGDRTAGTTKIRAGDCADAAVGEGRRRDSGLRAPPSSRHGTGTRAQAAGVGKVRNGSGGGGTPSGVPRPLFSPRLSQQPPLFPPLAPTRPANPPSTQPRTSVGDMNRAAAHRRGGKSRCLPVLPPPLTPPTHASGSGASARAVPRVNQGRRHTRVPSVSMTPDTERESAHRVEVRATTSDWGGRRVGGWEGGGVGGRMGW